MTRTVAMGVCFRWLFLVALYSLMSRDTQELLAERPNVMSRTSPVQVTDHRETRYYCSISELYEASMPKSYVQVDFNFLGATTSVKECLNKCCHVGPHICQYAWLSMGKCMAVACDIPSYCAPQSVARINIDQASETTYVKMYFSVHTSEVDSPPVAHAGPPLLVHLPQSEAYLYGNGSVDDKGIVKYQWNLISKIPLPIELDGADTDTLHVTNLKQGVYLFQLSVTDTAGQTSRTGVVVEVVRDDHIESTFPVLGTGYYPNTAVTLEDSITSCISPTATTTMLRMTLDTGIKTSHIIQTRTATIQPSQTRSSDLSFVATVLARAFVAEEHVDGIDSAGASSHGTMLWRLIITVLTVVGCILIICGVIFTVTACVQFKIQRRTERMRTRDMYRRLPRIEET